MPEVKLGDLSIELEPALGNLLTYAFDDLRDSVVAATLALWRHRSPQHANDSRAAGVEFQRIAREMLHAAKRTQALATDDIRDDLLTDKAQKDIAGNAGLPLWLVDQIVGALDDAARDNDHAALTAVARHFDIDIDPPEEQQ